MSKLSKDSVDADTVTDVSPVSVSPKNSPISKSRKRNRAEFENDEDDPDPFIANIDDEILRAESYDAETEAESLALAEEYERSQQTQNDSISNRESTVDSVANTNQNVQKCQEPNCGSLTICPHYFKCFGVSVCRECKWTDRYKCISKTKGKKEYLLSEGDMNALKCWIKKIKYGDDHGLDGPQDGSWRPKYMKLYLEYQLEELAIEKWGSKDGIEAERNKRAVARMQRAINSSRKKRKIQVECMDDVEIDEKVVEEHDANIHKHTFGESKCINEETDEWMKQCTECGYEETWEEF